MSQRFFEDYPVALTLEDARVAAGGRRKLRSATEGLAVLLPDGREVHVGVTLLPWYFHGMRAFLACPECGRAVTVLRHGPTTTGLACCADLKKMVRGLRYRSQTPARASP